MFEKPHLQVEYRISWYIRVAPPMRYLGLQDRVQNDLFQTWNVVI